MIPATQSCLVRLTRCGKRWDLASSARRSTRCLPFRAWDVDPIYLALAPRLKGQTARRALAALEHIRPDKRQAEILAEWVAWLEGDLLGQALNLTLAMSDLKAQRTVLYALVPRVSGDELQRALAGLSAMDDEYHNTNS